MDNIIEIDSNVTDELLADVVEKLKAAEGVIAVRLIG